MKKISISNVDETIYEYTCHNGLKVYMWQDNLAEEVNMTLTVKYGSIYTDFVVNNKNIHVSGGTAHYLEHIKFNEDDKTAAHDFFTNLGSYSNAYTTYDRTVYSVIASDHLKENLEHLLYFVFNPYFSKKLFDKEMPIITEEAKSVLDNPYSQGFIKILNNIYFNNQRKNWITGKHDEVCKITIDDVKNVFKTFYHPKNMFLTVTGNIEPEKIVSIVDNYFSDKKEIKYLEPKIVYPEEPDEVVKEKDSLKCNVAKEKLFLGFKIPKKAFPKYDDLNLLILLNFLMEINFSPTSLFNESIIKNKIVDDFYYTVNVDETHILLLFEASSDNPKNISDLIKEKMNNLEVIEEDFNRKVKVYIASRILDYEKPGAVNNYIVSDIVKYGRIINNLVDIYKDITLDDLKEVKEKLNYQVSELVLKPQK